MGKKSKQQNKKQRKNQAEQQVAKSGLQRGSELRFHVGTEVLCRIECNMDFVWCPGKIIQLWYREKNWPDDQFAPYHVKLDSGRTVYVPNDTDSCVKMKVPTPYVVAAEQAKVALGSRDFLSAADLYLKAVRLAPDVWTARRFHNFDWYCRSISRAAKNGSDADLTNRHIQELKNFLYSKEEPAVFRAAAASFFASVHAAYLEEAPDCIREGIAACDSASPGEKRRSILAFGKMTRVADMLKIYRENLREYLSKLLSGLEFVSNHDGEQWNSFRPSAAQQSEESGLPPEGQRGSKLRFEVGTKVLCRMNSVWCPGEIVRLWYQESDWPDDRFAPYQVRMDNGRLVYSSKDDDSCVKMKDSLVSADLTNIAGLLAEFDGEKKDLLSLSAEKKRKSVETQQPPEGQRESEVLKTYREGLSDYLSKATSATSPWMSWVSLAFIFASIAVLWIR